MGGCYRGGAAPPFRVKLEVRVLPSPCEAPVVLGVWTHLGLAPGRPFQWEVARAVELRQWLRMSDVGIEVHPWRLQRGAWAGLPGLGVAWVRTDSPPGGWAWEASWEHRPWGRGRAHAPRRPGRRSCRAGPRQQRGL